MWSGRWLNVEDQGQPKAVPLERSVGREEM